MGLNGGVYKFFLLLHLMAVIAGFGPTVVAGLFGLKARARGGKEGQAIAEATFEIVGGPVEWIIYTVPVFGTILVLVSDDAWKFSEAWISLSYVLFVVGIGVVHGVHRPNLRRMNELMGELNSGAGGSGGGGATAGTGGPPPQVAELEQRGAKAAMVGGLLNLLLVVLVILMVWKPGA